MIYLSWSIAHLVTALTVVCVGTFVAYKSKTVERKKLLVGFVCLVLANLYLAFDIGTRQQDLQRSSFDATVPTDSVDKTDRKTLDRSDVNKTFENTVKEIK